MPRTLTGLVLLVVSLFSAVAAEPQTKLEGRWEGSIKTPGVELQVIVMLRGADTQLTGTIDIPLQGAKGLPLAAFALNGPELSFAIKGVPGDPIFRGTLNETRARLTGLLHQAGQQFPFELTRTGEAGPLKTNQELLQGFDAWIEEQLKTWNEPGVAVAILRDDQVVLSKGYGLRDVANQLPMTEHTQLAIGSSTKALTATLVGTLVEEGKLDWDKPIKDYLPDLKLKDEVADRWITPADLLSHVSGLPRHDLAWYGSTATREELFERIRYFEPNATLRQRWQYNNFMFLAAGVLAERLAGAKWEQLIRERIFTPLGIEQASFSVSDLAAAPDHAVGYTEKDGKLEPVPYRNIDTMGPAGSINTSVSELIKWVRLQLSNGEVDGKRIVQPATLQQLHTPRAFITKDIQSREMPYMLYAMGWFVQPYRGHDLIHHGGNIDGFAAMAAFMPSERIGVVVLANKSGSPLPKLISLRAFDQLLDLEPSNLGARLKAQADAAQAAEKSARKAAAGERKPNTTPSHPLAEFTGEFENAGYGLATVAVSGKQLTIKANSVDVPLDHWHYDVFRAAGGDFEGLTLKFSTNLRGDIEAFDVVIDPTVSAVRYNRLPPQSMSESAFLQQFAGEYLLESRAVRVSKKGNNLWMLVDGQPEYKLLPYRGTTFDLDKLTGYSVRFVVEGEKVTEIKFIQPEGVYTAKRK